MHKNTKLLAIVVALLIVAVMGTLFVQMIQNQKKSSNTIRIACVGDSITEGSEYPNDLWMLLGKNYALGNFGHGGTTVSLNTPNSYMKEPTFQEAKDFQPNIVIIMLGTNDALSSFHIYNSFFVDDYLKLINEFQALASKPRIWLVLPPPIFNNGTGLSTEFFEQNVIPNIERAANKTNLPIINVYTALINHPECFPDGVHPNNKGSQLIAKEVFNAIAAKEWPSD
jgi:lysophospholipase L1-like esterase